MKINIRMILHVTFLVILCVVSHGFTEIIPALCGEQSPIDKALNGG